MKNYQDEYGVLDMSEEAMDTLELMTEKMDHDSCGPEGDSSSKKCRNDEKLTSDDKPEGNRE